MLKLRKWLSKTLNYLLPLPTTKLSLSKVLNEKQKTIIFINWRWVDSGLHRQREDLAP